MTNMETALQRITEAKENKATVLDLRGLRLKELPEQIEELAPYLLELDLSWNTVGESVAKQVSKLVNLTSLILWRSKLGEKEVEHISQLIHLRNLNLSGNYFGEKCAEYVSKLVDLTELDLSDNSIGEKGAENVSKLVKLTSLKLSGNSIGNQGAFYISKLSNLNDLDLTANAIGDNGAENISKLINLTNLKLSNNSIGNKGLEHISKLPNLTSLNMAKNSFDFDGAKHISKLANLTYLDLSSSAIGDTETECISKMVNLTYLNLSSNSIGENGAAHISKLVNLTYLNLSSNSIGEKGAEHLSKLVNLTNLKLLSNYIDANGAKHIAKLGNLTSLDLSVNTIGNLGAEHISKLSRLTNLELAFNSIDERGAEYISKLLSLVLLNLRRNSIGKKGAMHISKLINLNHLDLSGNSIGDIGVEHVSNLTNLNYLDLSENSIGNTSVEHFAKVVNLKHLTLTGNTIGDLGAEHFYKLSNLRFLNLTRNSLGAKGCEHISKASSLYSLHLSRNSIGDVGAEHISKMESLNELDLSYNSISDLGGQIVCRMINLILLGITDNAISNSKQFEGLDNLEHLFIFQNPLKDVPATLTSNFIELRHWWEETKHDTIPNTTVKLMFNGNGNAGKSTLFEALKYGKCTKEIKSTHAIEIDTWDWEELNQPVNFHVWDFGGQEIFHGTHRLFMQTQAVWLHVFDPETEQLARNNVSTSDRIVPHEQGRNHVLPFWVDEAGKGNPRIIVQTKKESNGKMAPKDEMYFKAAASWNADFEQVDSLTGSGITRLRSRLHEKAMEVTEYGMQMPKKWMETRGYFLSNLQKGQDSQKIMLMGEFHKLCTEQFGIRAEVLPTLLLFLHNSGVLYFNKKYLHNNIILDQRWALDAIYKPLERNTPFYNDLRSMYKGRVRADVLYTVFGEDYSIQEKRLFLELMKSCGLCYHLNTEVSSNNEYKQWYVFPEFLPNQITHTAKTLWGVGGKVHRTFRLNMPYLNYYHIQNFISQFGRKTENELVWRNGIVMQQGNALINVEADYECPGIVLRMAGDFPDRILWGIIHVFESQGKKLENTVWVEVKHDGSEIPIDLKILEQYAWDKKVEVSEQNFLDLLPDKLQKGPKRLVVSYANEDFQAVLDLKKCLANWVDNGELILIYDKRVMDGKSEPQVAVIDAFQDADGYLILTSIDYQNKEVKDFIWKEEYPVIKRKQTVSNIFTCVMPVGPVIINRDLLKFLCPRKGRTQYLPTEGHERTIYLLDFIEEVIAGHFLNPKKL